MHTSMLRVLEESGDNWDVCDRCGADYYMLDAYDGLCGACSQAAQGAPMKITRVTGVPLTPEQGIIGIDCGEDADGSDQQWLLVYEREKFPDPMAMLLAAAPNELEAFMEWISEGGPEELGFTYYSVTDFPTLKLQ